MSRRVLTQPGETGRLGELLKSELGDVGWTEFRAAVAFVKRSGVRHIAEELAAFARRASIRMSVGVDRRGSSQEGLQLLVDSVVAHGGRVWIFRNADPQVEPTFHPKVYLFKRPDRALAIIGSGNLTGGGLWTNYEAGIALDLDLVEADDAEILRDVESMLDAWCDETQALARPLSTEHLARLVAAGEAPTESRTRRDESQEDAPQGGMGVVEKAQAESGLFGRVRVPGPPPSRLARGGGARSARAQSKPAMPTPIAAAPGHGRVLWQKKNLKRTDVQQTPAGTHAVGGVRLTQAGFKDARGRLIDWKKYFRRTIFGRFGWSTVKTQPVVEEARVPFEVRLLGKSYGVHELVISDKQSGEASQHNYTSILRWGDLASSVRGLPSLVGLTLTIYGPLAEGSPHVLEIA